MGANGGVTVTRDYDSDEFIPWYREATPTWLELSDAERGVLVSVAMELNPKTGERILRRGLSSLALVVQIPWERLEPALARLIALGKLEWDGGRFALRDPGYLERKRKTSTERVREFRARQRSAGNEGNVSSVSGTQRREEKIREEKKEDQIYVPAKAVTGPADEVWAHYVATVKRHRPRRRPGALSPKDRKHIGELLKSGFTAEDIKRAVSGLFRSPHHLGQNDRGTEYLELTYALRKPSTYIALDDEASPPVSTPPPPEHDEFVDPSLIAAAEAALSKRAS